MGKTARRSVASNKNPSTPYSLLLTQKVGEADASSNATQYFAAAQNNSVNATQTLKNGKYINQTAIDEVAAERERIRAEFYATYDVMTGVRIAATLGCLFALMVFLIVYKSRRASDPALDDPDIAATAAAVLEEEEEREIQEVWEATRKVLLEEDMNLDLNNSSSSFRPRMLSLGNISAPPVLNLGSRYSSISGGYNSLLKPPRRYSTASSIGVGVGATATSKHLLKELRMKRRGTLLTHDSPNKLQQNISAYRRGAAKLKDVRQHSHQEYMVESDGEEADDEFEQITVTADINYQPPALLSVPKGQDSRRSSGMTCCSTESSFLERRISAMSLGITSLPSVSQCPSRRPSYRDSPDIDIERGDSLLRPNIEIIKATPKTSPCSSERVIVERRGRSTTHGDDDFDCISEYPEDVAPTEKTMTSKRQPDTESRRAPLASLSSFRLSSAECPDSDEAPRSVGSDTVFDEYCADTEDEMDQLSMDSDRDKTAAMMTTFTKSPPKSILKNSANSSSHTDKCICDSILSHAGSSGSGGGIVGNNEVILVRDSDSNKVFSITRKSKTSKPSIFSKLAHTFETKAIIERHDNKKCGSDTMIQRIQRGSLDLDGALKLSSRSNSISRINCRDDSDSYDTDDGLKVKIEAQKLLTARLVDAATIVRDLSPVVVLELPELAAQGEQKERDDERAEQELASGSLDPSPGSSRKWSRETLF